MKILALITAQLLIRSCVCRQFCRDTLQQMWTLHKEDYCQHDDEQNAPLSSSARAKGDRRWTVFLDTQPEFFKAQPEVFWDKDWVFFSSDIAWGFFLDTDWGFCQVVEMGMKKLPEVSILKCRGKTWSTLTVTATIIRIWTRGIMSSMLKSSLIPLLPLAWSGSWASKSATWSELRLLKVRMVESAMMFFLSYLYPKGSRKKTDNLRSGWP